MPSVFSARALKKTDNITTVRIVAASASAADLPQTKKQTEYIKFITNFFIVTMVQIVAASRRNNAKRCGLSVYGI